MKRRALILGVHSFIDSNLKVGIQFIAEGLADYGWCVDYVSLFSSPFDIIGLRRRKRLKRVWIKRQFINGIKIQHNLTEYAFQSFFSARNTFLRYNWQKNTIRALAPKWIRTKKYDFCIHDVTSNIIYLPLIHAKYKILRLNDLPEGFRHNLSMRIINCYKNYICSKRYDEIWSAHEPLTQYALELNPENKVVTIRNGVDSIFLSMPDTVNRKLKTAVYLGSSEQWVDLELLNKTALLMPDWQFDVIGPLNRAWPGKAQNLQWLPPIPKEKVAETLSRYQVGLIPYREINGRIKYVERPLKLFEYIGAGLGVACTDVGSLKSGIGKLASFGNSPEAFSDAIRKEALRVSIRSRERCREIIGPHTWPKVMKKINFRLKSMGI